MLAEVLLRIIAVSEFHSEMSETRRWLVRTREMERREIEDKKGVKKIEENYKHLVSIVLLRRYTSKSITFSL